MYKQVKIALEPTAAMYEDLLDSCDRNNYFIYVVTSNSNLIDIMIETLSKHQ